MTDDSARTLSVAVREAGRERSLWGTAILVVMAYALGSILLPGARGSMSEGFVSRLEFWSSTLSVAAVLFLGVQTMGAALRLSVAHQGAAVARTVAVSLAGGVLALTVTSAVIRLHPLFLMGLSVVACSVAFACVRTALLSPESRAVALVLAILSFASLLRTSGWQLMFLAGEKASLTLFSTSRIVLMASTAMEAIGQVVAVAWLGSRSVWRGRLFSNIAIVVAFTATFFAARTLHSPESSAWSRALAYGVARVLSSTQPLSPLSAFLGISAPLLAIVALAQPRSVRLPAVCLALLLCSRGAYDIPLAALASVVAALSLLQRSFSPGGGANEVEGSS